MTPRVLFLCKKRVSNYGVSTGLLNSSQFIVNFLNSESIEAKVVECLDANQIDREVFHYKPTHVVISAIWVTSEKLEVLARKYKNIKWQIRIHSKTPFISNEGIAMTWISEYNELRKKYHNIQITANSDQFQQALNKSLNIPVIHLPNIYIPTYTPKTLYKPCKTHVHVACFGAIRPMKNHLTQALAAMEFANKHHLHLCFHINGDRTEQHGEQVLKNLRGIFQHSNHELIEHNWMSHTMFLDLISQMDIGLQVSLSETFNIVCADFVHCNIPMVVSESIEWMPKIFTAEPDNVKQIANKISLCYKPWIRYFINAYNTYKLKQYNKAAKQIWLQYLKK